MVLDKRRLLSVQYGGRHKAPHLNFAHCVLLQGTNLRHSLRTAAPQMGKVGPSACRVVRGLRAERDAFPLYYLTR